MVRLICSRCGFTIVTGVMTAFTRNGSDSIEVYPHVSDFPHERRMKGEKPGMLVQDYCLACKKNVQRVICNPGEELGDAMPNNGSTCPECGEDMLVSKSPGSIACPICGRGTMLMPGHLPLEADRE